MSSLVPADFGVEDVKKQVEKIQQLMRSVMRDGEHYGVIPGTHKPSLLKAGAEKLCFLFRLAPDFEVTMKELSGAHREYTVVCRLRSMSSGEIVGTGMGSCSTMEKKYRYRKEGGRQIENPDIADLYNTVLKMAKKRAHVDATITACAASDIFTQDVEDMEAEPQPQQGPSPMVKLTDDLAKIMRSKDDSGKDYFPEEERAIVRAKVQQYHKDRDVTRMDALVREYKERLESLKVRPVQEAIEPDDPGLF